MERTLTSAVIAFLFVVVGGLASAGWFKYWGAARERDLVWEAKLAQANEQWMEHLAEVANRLTESDQKLEKELEDARRLRKERDEALARQREAVPLSDACSACSIPWERLFVRDGKLGARKLQPVPSQ